MYWPRRAAFGWDDGGYFLGGGESLLCAFTKEMDAEGSMLVEQQLQYFSWGSVQAGHLEIPAGSLSASRGWITDPISKQQMENWELEVLGMVVDEL